jgi:hypothetical protein
MSQQWVVTQAIVCRELPLLSLLEALLKWLQKGGKGYGMWNNIRTEIEYKRAFSYRLSLLVYRKRSFSTSNID